VPILEIAYNMLSQRFSKCRDTLMCREQLLGVSRGI
jgi:hypothetical protein